MTDTAETNVPGTNFRGLAEHWRTDLISGFSVALVALPLALGIAGAAGAPPLSGLISVVVAGGLATFLRGSHVAINGPGNALIVIIATGFTAFGGGAEAFPHVLGAIVVAGGLQVVFGVLRFGKLGALIPSAVIQGLLAAIGLIIVGKQAHVLFGSSATSASPIDVFLELPGTIAAANPVATVIGIVGILVLLFHPRVKSNLVRFVPAPLWVVAFAVPVALLYNRYEPSLATWLGEGHTFEGGLLVQIPSDLLGSIVTPSFSRITEPGFWGIVFLFALVCSIENTVSVKAVDKLDPYGRASGLDRDLIAMGISTMASGMIGGLPVLTVIARSSVNLNHGGKTGWSNFFQGAVILVFVGLLSGFIGMIPLAALAGILVYTGYKLAAPRVFRESLDRGPDHFVVLCITLGATLTWGLLYGVAVGLAAELLSHQVILNLSPRKMLRRIWRSRVDTVHEDGEPYLLRVQGVANYLNIPRLRSALEQASSTEHVIVDFSLAELVDNTLLEYCHDFGGRFEQEHPDGRFEVIGLEAHRPFSDHPDTTHVLDERSRGARLTPRQQRIQERCEAKGWELDVRRDWDPGVLDEFRYFRVHPFEYRETVVHGRYELHDTELRWSLSDVTFDEGALITDVYHSTVQVLELPRWLPPFVLEKEDLFDRVLVRAGFRDTELKSSSEFSKNFIVKSRDDEAIHELMTPELVALLESAEGYHIESNGRHLSVFKFLRLASAVEIDAMLEFSKRLMELVLAPDGAHSIPPSPPKAIAAPDSGARSDDKKSAATKSKAAEKPAPRGSAPD